MHWHPIETAPKDRAILIREHNHMPDFVRWKNKQPDKKVNGNLWIGHPEGWFRVFAGSRSHILNPTEWLDIPK